MMILEFVRTKYRAIGRPSILLFILGALLVFGYLFNAVVMFDDLYMPRHFAELVREEGRWHAAAMIFTGADLPREYRTYGLSRLLQFVLWSIFGGASTVYPLVISSSQGGAAFLLMKILRRAGLSDPTALAVSALWLMSPFCMTWTFHHYSYLILPFQMLILTVYLLGGPPRHTRVYLIPLLLGFACALTGEMQLPATILALTTMALLSKHSSAKKLAWTALAAFIATLALHRLNWWMFLRDESLVQRFNIRFEALDLGASAASVWAATHAMFALLERQSTEIASGGVAVGVVFAIVVTGCFLFCTAPLERRGAPVGKIETRTATVFLLLSFASFSIYVVLAVLLGQKDFLVPRRYGYVSLTLFVILFAVVIGEIVNALSWPIFGVRRLGYSVVLFFVATMAGTLHIHALPSQRATDEAITARILKAKGDRTLASGGKAVLFFVASDKEYWSGSGDTPTLGPKTDTVDRRELFESPWGVYWTAKSYAVDFLGFEYAAMTSHCRSGATDERKGGSLSCDSKWAYPPKPIALDNKNVVVVANLALEKYDPLGRGIHVFGSFDEFISQDFGRRIERDTLAMAIGHPDEFIVDLGSKKHEASNVLPDKRLADPAPTTSAWVKNYGLLSGADGVYSHPDIRNDLASYQTNRNGAFAYQVEFREPVDVEVSLEFWEQWGHRAGERLFNLEVAWSGQDWAIVDTIDMAALNGHKPFSIILAKRMARSFLFRLTPVKGSPDVPVIQNVRLRPLGQSGG
ncbi:hypothetical protein [Variovorax sp. ZT4R33]|uniref:hypothetical protein n=1 Tax=Variovorax sp. ZT4R33 TaxID=3443743 RepID=UPI003F4485E7